MFYDVYSHLLPKTAFTPSANSLLLYRPFLKMLLLLSILLYFCSKTRKSLLLAVIFTGIIEKVCGRYYRVFLILIKTTEISIFCLF